jgi:para-aminobenzoate synthetase component I
MHRLEQAYAAIQEAIKRVASTLPEETDILLKASRTDDHHLSRLPLKIDGQSLTSSLTRDEYLSRIERIKEHIAAGDIYQANLTQQLKITLAPARTPERIFLRLRRTHPASFSAFIRRHEDAVVSASPERFLRVGLDEEKQRWIEAWPIKGTRARGVNAAEDERLRTELRESEKDRAENVMIVDLMRNDLGRVCQYGSVEVTELCAIQEHPTLFHLVSKVRGLLREDVKAADLMRAAFPCGSITGAPKLRAMEIIDEVESAPRGLSMGAIGYFSFDGRLDLSVAIRTMTIRESTARFNVGGGIVADSDPALEYEESLTKAHALLRALSLKG